MTKPNIHFEIIPVEVAKKILNREIFPAKSGGNDKKVIKKARRANTGLHVVPRKTEVLSP